MLHPNRVWRLHRQGIGRWRVNQTWKRFVVRFGVLWAVLQVLQTLHPRGGCFLSKHYNSQIRVLLSDGMAVKKKRRVYNTRIVCLGQIGRRMKNIGRQRPIGVFDSGIGGLTNVRALMERLPMENIIYLAIRHVCLMGRSRRRPLSISPCRLSIFCWNTMLRRWLSRVIRLRQWRGRKSVKKREREKGGKNNSL